MSKINQKSVYANNVIVVALNYEGEDTGIPEEYLFHTSTEKNGSWFYARQTNAGGEIQTSCLEAEDISKIGDDKFMVRAIMNLSQATEVNLPQASWSDEAGAAWGHGLRLTIDLKAEVDGQKLYTPEEEEAVRSYFEALEAWKAEVATAMKDPRFDVTTEDFFKANGAPRPQLPDPEKGLSMRFPGALYFAFDQAMFTFVQKDGKSGRKGWVMPVTNGMSLKGTFYIYRISGAGSNAGSEEDVKSNILDLIKEDKLQAGKAAATSTSTPAGKGLSKRN